MAERELKRRPAPQRQAEQTEEEQESPQTSEKGEKLKAEIDDILDEIDEVLEDNAEEFVRNSSKRAASKSPTVTNNSASAASVRLVPLYLFPPAEDPGPSFVDLLRRAHRTRPCPKILGFRSTRSHTTTICRVEVH